ncbi:MAG: hypothetical protein ACOC31_04300 [Bacteroidota bacterium]
MLMIAVEALHSPVHSNTRSVAGKVGVHAIRPTGIIIDYRLPSRTIEGNSHSERLRVKRWINFVVPVKLPKTSDVINTLLSTRKIASRLNVVFLPAYAHTCF